MKPAWDKLMAEFADSPTALVADVDCTAAGKELCTKVGVKGYPTIKHGDPNNLEDYQGGRDFDSLHEFASENLGPSCGPANMDLCSDEKKAEIEEIQKMGKDAISEKVKALEKQIEDAEETFNTKLKELQNTYEQLQKTKDETIADAKGQNLGIMKAVLAHLKSGAADGDGSHDEL